MIAGCLARIREAEGHPARGWMSPWVNESMHTPELLAAAGVRYLLDWPCDDQPFWLRTASGPLMALPYARPTNDISALQGAKLSPRAWVDCLFDAFDQMLETSVRRPLVFNVSLHPYLIGHAFRLKPFRQFLRHLAAHRDQVWIARPGAIAAHAERCLPPPGGEPGSS